MRIVTFVSDLGIWHIKDALSGQLISNAAGFCLEPHCFRMSATLDDAVCHPDLQFVVEAVPDAAASDFISTQSGHGSAFFVTTISATEAALLSDERSLATSRTKITCDCCVVMISIPRDCVLWGRQSQISFL